MNTQELIKKVRKIEISARNASKQLFAGQYKSAFKGMGMEFAEVRHYFPGDETRAIDWNVTARLREPFVKTFEEEKELSVMLLVDISASTLIGSSYQSKKEYIAEVCAVLAFSAIYSNDKVGVVFFSDRIEKYIPPGKGKQHVLRIIRDLLGIEAKGSGTDIGKALSFFNNTIKRSCSVFLVSDFLTGSYEKELKLVRSRHDLMVLKIEESIDSELPSWSYLSVKDVETGAVRTINTSSKKYQKAYKEWRAEYDALYQKLIKKLGVDSVSLKVSESYVKPLKLAFKKR